MMVLQLCSLLKSNICYFLQNLVNQERPKAKGQTWRKRWCLRERTEVTSFDCQVAKNVSYCIERARVTRSFTKDFRCFNKNATQRATRKYPEKTRIRYSISSLVRDRFILNSPFFHSSGLFHSRFPYFLLFGTRIPFFLLFGTLPFPYPIFSIVRDLSIPVSHFFQC